jgi:hypothetical protein
MVIPVVNGGFKQLVTAVSKGKMRDYDVASRFQDIKSNSFA